MPIASGFSSCMAASTVLPKPFRVPSPTPRRVSASLPPRGPHIGIRRSASTYTPRYRWSKSGLRTLIVLHINSRSSGWSGRNLARLFCVCISGGCRNESKVYTALRDDAWIGGVGWVRGRLLRSGGATSSALWRGGICARAGVCVGGWILGQAWGKLVLGPGTVGASAQSSCGMGSVALGADRSRLPARSRPVAVGDQ